jgi:acyl-CoA thioesterase FadM
MPEPINTASLLWLHQAEVRPEWVDYNGHMSEAYYVLIFGEATDAFYDHVGLNDAFRRQEHISVYTLEAHIRYLVEAHAGQHLRIATHVVWHDAKRLRLHHSMVDQAGRTLAVTELAALHVDTTGPRGCPFRAGPLARIAEIAAAHRGLVVREPAMTAHWLGEKRPGALPLDPAGDTSPDPVLLCSQNGGGLALQAASGARTPRDGVPACDAPGLSRA